MPPLPYSANDLRSMQWWLSWAAIQANQARMQAMLAGNGDAAKQLYDDYTPLMRGDNTIDAPFEPVDTHSPIWNNSAPL